MITALESLPTSIANLRTIATPAVDYRIMPFGIPELDDRLASRGLRAGALHEVAAQSCSMVDDAAATLFLAGIAAREAAHTGGPVLWVSCRNDLYSSNCRPQDRLTRVPAIERTPVAFCASAKGVLFITIEDETGIANGILWPDRFERQRRTVMSASMISMKGRVQKEGEVIHVICDRIIDHGDLLHRVGEMSFPHRTGRGDGAKHAGSPDRGDKGWNPSPRNSYWPPHADGMDPEAVVKFKSHDFH